MDEKEQKIKEYFEKNCTHMEIKELLLKDNIVISITTIKRILSRLNLKRKNIQESSLEEIVHAVVEELNGAGYNLGYRGLWQKLKTKYKLSVKRATVYKVLQVADPENVANRYGNRLHRREYLNPGPNYLWHVDGYDKLKKFGFAIHGCVDGFSRMILWLEVASTNNNPKVIAHYYLSTVKKLGFLPSIIRSDKGSENSIIESLQIALRSKHNDKLAGGKSFITGKSTRNQRIESFWGRMRQHSADFFIQFFKGMQMKNLFDESVIHKHCLQFCFGPIIQSELQLTKQLWNNHQIRKQAVCNNINGKPFVLYNLPQKFKAKDYKKDVNVTDLDKLFCNYATKPSLVNPLFKELVDILLPNYSTPSTVEEALTLYEEILKAIDNVQ